MLSYRSVRRYLGKLQLSINNESINGNSNNPNSNSNNNITVTSNVAVADAVIQDNNTRQGCIIA